MNKVVNKPDSAAVSAVNQIRMNPRFVKLLNFSCNVLNGLTRLPNVKHRDNVGFIIRENAHKNIIQTLVDHAKNETVVLNSVTLLYNIVGSIQFRDEKIAQLLVSEGLIPKLIELLKGELQPETRSVRGVEGKAKLGDLRPDRQPDYVTADRCHDDQLGGGDGDAGTAGEEARAAVDAADAALALPQVQKQLVEVGELARATVGLLWEEPVTALCVLEQVMAKACNLEEVLEKKIVTREQVVQLMEGQKSKDVSVVAARVLSSIVGSDEVSQACLSIQQVDDHTASSCELLSNLLLADSDIDVDHLLADLLAILHNHTQVSQRHDGVLILKSVLGAITRVIDLKGVAIRVDCQDQLVAIDCQLLEVTPLLPAILENLKRLHTDKLAQPLPSIVQAIVAHPDNTPVQTAGLQLLIITHQNIPQPLDPLISHLFQLLQTEEVTELASRLLYLLANQPGVLSHADTLPAIIQSKSTHRLPCLYLLKIAHIALAKDSIQDKQGLFLALIQVLYPRLAQDNADHLQQPTQPLTADQELHLTSIAQAIITLLVKEGDIFSHFNHLQDAANDFKFNKKTNHLEVAILKIAYIILLQDLGSFTLKIDVFPFLVKQNFTDNAIVLAILKYIRHQVQLYRSELCQPDYVAKDIGLSTFNYLMALLTKTQDADVILNALDCLTGLVEKKGSWQVANTELVAKVLQVVKELMVKNDGDEKLQIKCLSVLKTYLALDEFRKLLLEDVRMLILPLNDESTSTAWGVNAIQVLYALAYRSKQNVGILFQQGVQHSIFRFIKSNENSEEVRSVCQPLLLLLSNYSQEKFFSKELEAEIVQLITNLDGSKEVDLICQSAISLSIYSLVDILFGFMCQNNLLVKLSSLLNQYQTDPFYETIQTDKIIRCSAILLTKTTQPNTIPKQINQSNQSQIVNLSICQTVLQIITQRTHSDVLIYHTLLFIENALKNHYLEAQLIDDNHFSTFVMLNSKYQNDESITKTISRIIFELIKTSKHIAEKKEVLRFLPNLIRQTESLILFEGGSKESQINQNLRWVLELSKLEPFQKRFEAQVVELCYTLIKFETSSERMLVVRTSPMQKKRTQSVKKEKYRTDLKNLEIAFKALEVFAQSPTKEQVELILRVLSNFDADEYTLESCLVYVSSKCSDESVVALLQELEGWKVLRSLQEQTNHYKVHELINKILVKLPGESEGVQEVIEADGGIEQFEVEKMRQEMKKLREENESLRKESELKKAEMEELRSEQQEDKEQLKNYTEEFLDQTRIIGEKLMALKKAEREIKELKEEIKKLNEITGGGLSLQEQQIELNQALELQLQQNQQLEMLCEQQLNEIELLTQVKNEQDGLIQELQKQSNYEKTAEAQLTKEDVGTPDDSKDSEVYQLEDELREKDAQIEQLAVQVQELEELREKVKFVEDKNKVLKLKLAVSDQKHAKTFWDIVISSPNSHITQLARSSWEFLILNHDDIENHQQSVAVFAFDASLLQHFVDGAFNYAHQADGILGTLTSSDKTYIKTLSPPFLNPNKHSKKSFILTAKLFDRSNYSKSQYVPDDVEDRLAFEEFWLQYAFSQNGFVVFVCKHLGTEEYELLKKMCYIQLLSPHQRLVVFVQGDHSILTGELQMVPAKPGQPSKSPRVVFTLNNQLTQVMAALLKQDKATPSYAFVDQLREFILANYPNYLQANLQDFGIGELDQGQGFKLSLIMDHPKVKVRKPRPTDFLATEIQVNVKYHDDEVKLDVYPPWGELIIDHKVKIYNQENQGCKVYIKLETQNEEDKLKYRVMKKVSFGCKVKKVEREKKKVTIKLEKE